MKPKWSSVFDEEDDDEGPDYCFEGEEDNNMVLENEDFEIVDENEESSGNNQTLEEEIRRQEFQGDVEQQNINNEDENIDESSCIPPVEFEGQHHQGLENDQLIMEEFTEEDEEQETLIMEEEGNDLVEDDSLNHTVGFQSEVVYSDGEEEEELGYFEPLIDEIRKPFDPKTINIARLPTEKRHSLNERHPKFRDLNNMQIIQRMVTKGKVVNPADDEDEDDMHFSMMEENILLKKGIAIRKEFRKPEDRNGNEIMVSKNNQSCTLYLGGGIPLEPVLAHPKLNDEVERFRKELAKHRKEWSTVSFLHPKKRAWKVDPSSIVPASVSGSTGSSSIGSETDPECLATDDESETELMPGSIAAWIVPDATGSRSPSPAEPEFEVEEPEFIITTAGSHSNEPPAKKRKQKHEPQPHIDGKIYPKPGFSYSCLIAMSLKNSKTGCLPVSEIYKFMCDHFPYFKTAPSGWKNSVRHNLSLNKCFEKIEKPGNGARKGCLWALNPAKIHKMDEEVQKWSRKDPLAIRRAMSDPENLELLERGELKKDYSGNGSDEEEDEDFNESSLTQAQIQARRSRTSSSDSAFGEGRITATPQILTTVSQVHAALHRPADQKIHLKKDDPLEFGTITSVQGNYICTTPGSQTYTLSFSNLGSTTPIIIRRTPVK